MKYICDEQRHLICLPYSINNLHLMAKDLNIKRCWYHSSSKYPHYDIPKKRIKEIQGKSILVTPKTTLKLIKGIMEVKDLIYKIFWSEEDQEYVATTEQMPGMSVLNKDPIKAFAEVIILSKDILNDVKEEDK